MTPSQSWQSKPPLFFYAPLVKEVIRLSIAYKTSPAIIRHANPLFMYGGLPFDSKSEMCSHFDQVIPYRLLSIKTSPEERLKTAFEFTGRHNYPLILKPDTGHRGVGVQKVDSETELLQAVSNQKWDLILQKFDSGPLEYGVFYIRKPGQKTGHVVSLTQKVIPEGMVAASHCRGAEFYNHTDRVTAELESTVNRLCQEQEFYFGRFDVKASDEADFYAGKDFRIIEVNGATSEMIHIFDPQMSKKDGYATLKGQWQQLFEISHLNRGTSEALSFGEFTKRYLQFFKQTKNATGSWW